MESYITVSEHSVFEYEDRKSVFIGEAMPVSTEADAIRFIESVKKKYPDARHHVYAYVLRENFTSRFTDDREPSGTAGMPVLDAIRKNGITDAVVVVTRYFGGTLLGTGGLVRAYTSAAIGALNAAGIAKYDIYAELTLELGYSEYQKIGKALSDFDFRTEDSEFLDRVTLRGRVLASLFEDFSTKLTEICSGRVKIDKIQEKFSK